MPDAPLNRGSISHLESTLKTFHRITSVVCQLGNQLAHMVIFSSVAKNSFFSYFLKLILSFFFFKKEPNLNFSHSTHYITINFLTVFYLTLFEEILNGSSLFSLTNILCSYMHFFS